METLAAVPDVSDLPGATPLPDRATGRVQFDHVSFAYDPARLTLDDVPIEAEPGQVVALVGPTGAGKTTIASLLCRFYDPTAGRVLLDDVDLCQITLASLRSQISLVLQDPHLLPISIAENIAYGLPGAPLADIRAAAVA